MKGINERYLIQARSERMIAWYMTRRNEDSCSRLHSYRPGKEWLIKYFRADGLISALPATRWWEKPCSRPIFKHDGFTLYSGK